MSQAAPQPNPQASVGVPLEPPSVRLVTDDRALIADTFEAGETPDFSQVIPPSGFPIGTYNIKDPVLVRIAESLWRQFTVHMQKKRLQGMGTFAQGGRKEESEILAVAEEMIGKDGSLKTDTVKALTDLPPSEEKPEEILRMTIAFLIAFAYPASALKKNICAAEQRAQIVGKSA